MNARPPLTAADLGTVLSIWAHPDDETYLAAGVMAAAAERRQRVVCVTATAGELGTDDPDTWPPARLGAVRRWEAAAAMAVLGVAEHRVLGFPDGELAADDERGIAVVGRLLDEVRPDTILTFGPDGITFHPDHIAMSRWVTEAWERRRRPCRLLYATTTVEHVETFGARYEEWGVYMTADRPVGVATADLDLHICLDGPPLDRKLTALRAQATQTTALIELLGPDLYATLVADETFVDAGRQLPASHETSATRAASGSVPA